MESSAWVFGRVSAIWVSGAAAAGLANAAPRGAADVVEGGGPAGAAVDEATDDASRAGAGTEAATEESADAAPEGAAEVGKGEVPGATASDAAAAEAQAAEVAA